MHNCITQSQWFNLLRSRKLAAILQNTYSKYVLYENVSILFQTSLKLVRKVVSNNNWSLAQIITWKATSHNLNQSGSDLLARIWVTRPQWIKITGIGHAGRQTDGGKRRLQPDHDNNLQREGSSKKKKKILLLSFHLRRINTWKSFYISTLEVLL